MTSGESTVETVETWIARLLDAAASGSALDLRSGHDEEDDAAGGASWGDERTVPAEALVGALLAHEADGRPLRTLRLQGARVDGVLDLRGQRIAVPLVLEDCHFAEPLLLSAVELPSLTLSGCVLAAALDAKGACIHGDLMLVPDVRCTGRLELKNARITGDLALHGTFSNPGTVAISGANMSVGGDMGCMPGFQAEGEVLLRSAHVAGTLLLIGGRFSNPRRVAISADRIAVDGTLFCRDGFEAEGEVRLLGARVGNQVAFAGAHFANPGDDALSADGIVVDGDFSCVDGLIVEGDLRLLGSRIAGDLSLKGGNFLNPEANAISADRMVVGGGVFLNAGFVAHGAVRMLNARVGSLTLTGGHFANPGRVAFGADGTVVHGPVFCGVGFVAEGELRLPGTHVGSDVDLSSGRFVNPGACAIAADRITVEGNLFCRDAFAAEGQVRLFGAHVNGQLCVTGTVRVPPRIIALDLEDAEIAHTLFLRPAAPLEGWVDLTNTTVAHLQDNDDAWAGGYELRGFRYQTLAEEPGGTSARRRSDGVLQRRLAWLRGNRSGYHPQIYEQLAEHCRTGGHDARQRTVLIQKQRQRRRQASPLARAWSFLEDLLVGYGYRTWQAVIPWIAAVVFGSLYFHAHRDDIVQRIPRQQPPTFHSITYTLDLLLPVVNLGQRDNWVAHHGAQTVATVLILAGWVLTTAILAALTGLVRRTN